MYLSLKYEHINLYNLYKFYIFYHFCQLKKKLSKFYQKLFFILLKFNNNHF